MRFIFPTTRNGTLVSLHVSEVGCPAADAASGSGPEPQPPAPTQSAQCNAVKVGPAERKSHPGKREMQTSYKHVSQHLHLCMFLESTLTKAASCNYVYCVMEPNYSLYIDIY